MAAVGAIDQGTTGTKALVLSTDGGLEVVANLRHAQHYPRPGWVEHDAGELLDQVLAAAEALGEVAALGLANQGETVVAWDADSGRPVHNAIVWQDDRTSGEIERLKAAGAEALTLERAGLPLDPYFSASKLRWLIDNAPDAGRLLAAGRLRLGTSDAFFLDRLTGLYATDPTTASRTSLMDLRRGCWDPELCALFGVPMEALPEIRPTAGDFGAATLGGRRIPVAASVVDQQAALFGHGCLGKGQTKVTFGTGAFALANTGGTPYSAPEQGILSTLAWKIGEGAPAYAIDGGVYNAASALEWIKALGLFESEAEIDAFEGAPAIARGLAFVPALSGLACPYWDRSAAGLWIGLGQDTSREDLCRAVLEGIALRTAQLIARFAEITGRPAEIPVDGGLSNNRYFCQFFADVTGLPVVVPAVAEMTGYGAARLALLGAGLVSQPGNLPAPPPPRHRYQPRGAPEGCMARFDDAVERARGWR
jgi:glycerol kinase